MTLCEYLRRNVHATPYHTFIRYKGESINFADFDQDVSRLAGFLVDNSLEKGEIVALLIPNIPEFVVSYYAVLKAGLVSLPLNILHTPAELAVLMKRARATALIYWGGFARKVKEIRDIIKSLKVLVSIDTREVDDHDYRYIIENSEPLRECGVGSKDDLAVIMFTGGRTTGFPRGVLLSHQNICSNAEACARLSFVSRKDRFLAVLPLFYSFGHTAVMNLSMILGASISILDRIDPAEMLKVIQEDKISVIIGVPSIFKKILQKAKKEGVKLPTLRTCFSGGSPLNLKLYEEFKDYFGINILEGYGLTECSPVVTFNHFEDCNRPGSVGVPVNGISLKIVDEYGRELPPGQIGELLVKGSCVCLGYLDGKRKGNDSFSPDGWLKTGDLFYQDDEGYFYFVGKKDFLINRYGFPVCPEEIEARLKELKEVKEAVIIGRKHPEKKEEIIAFLVLENGENKIEGLEDYLRKQLPAYSRPDEIHYLPALPRSSTGRVLRDKLISMIVNNNQLEEV